VVPLVANKMELQATAATHALEILQSVTYTPGDRCARKKDKSLLHRSLHLLEQAELLQVGSLFLEPL
jgi:hypothetical protein